MFEPAIEDLTEIMNWLPPDTHSNEVKSARQLIGWAIDNLQRAPTDMSRAIENLLAKYAEKQTERYVVREGLSISFAETTAAKLASLLPAAQAMVATGQGSVTFWIDDGPTKLDVPAEDIVNHAAAYTMLYSQILAWLSAKRKEIEQSDNPLAVEL